MCIDAHLPQCDCHLGKETFGRLINPSRRRSNQHVVNCNGEVEDVILFIASQTTWTNFELFFKGQRRRVVVMGHS